MAKSKNSKMKLKAKVKSKTVGKVLKKKPTPKPAKKTLKPKVAAKVKGKAKGKVPAKVKTKTKTKTKTTVKIKVKAKIKAKSKAKPMAAPKKAPKALKKKVMSPTPPLALKSPQTATKLSNLLTPLDDRLIVQVHPQELKTAGGLYIPDTAAAGNSGNLKGTVLSAGRGHQNKKGRVRPMDVKPGDQIVFSEFAGSKIVIDGKDLIVIRETEVLGIIA